MERWVLAEPRSASVSRVATLGMFDGVHCGHKALLGHVASRTRKWPGSQSSLITFHPHPLTVLRKPIPFISTRRQQTEAVKQCGIDEIVEIPFTRELSLLSPEDFIGRYLQAALHVVHFVLGPDTAFGRDRIAEGQKLQQLLAERGISSEVFESVSVDGEKISSRKIRVLIAQGHVSQANDLLGRPFGYEGVVLKGDGRGHPLGFPTLNIDPNRSEQVVPGRGVYLTRTKRGTELYPSVTNVGYRPTFDGTELRIETHVLESSSQIDWYGESVDIQFIQYMRSEKSFTSAEDLRSQIQKDVSRAIELHRTLSSSPL